jgi:hypothetical protein
MSQLSDGFSLVDVVIISVENICLFSFICKLHFFVSFTVGFERLKTRPDFPCWDSIYFTYSSRTVLPGRDALLVDSESVLFELIQVLKLPLQLSDHEHSFSILLHEEGVTCIISKMILRVLIQTKSR